MTDAAIALTIERLVLDGIEIPVDDAARLPGLVEAEVRRMLHSGLPTPADAASRGTAETRPLILSTPPDVAVLARELAQRLLDAAAAAGDWDG